MPPKRGAARRSKIVDKERKFEEAHRRAEEKRRRREAERELARQEDGSGVPAGEEPAGR